MLLISNSKKMGSGFDIACRKKGNNANTIIMLQVQEEHNMHLLQWNWKGVKWAMHESRKFTNSLFLNKQAGVHNLLNSLNWDAQNFLQLLVKVTTLVRKNRQDWGLVCRKQFLEIRCKLGWKKVLFGREPPVKLGHRCVFWVPTKTHVPSAAML